MTRIRTSRISMALACTWAALAVLGGLGMATGCRAGAESSGAGGREGKAVRAPGFGKSLSLDPRDQYELAAALTDVESARSRQTGQQLGPGDPDDIAVGYEKIRASWTGKRYRWRVYVLPPLCRAPDACNVLPFDRGGRDKQVVQGWMPRLILDESGFAAVQKVCAGRPMCEVEVEGTLSQLIVDAENPTSLEFRDINVL